MGWGPVRSSQNTSYDQISDKNYYIYQIWAIMSNFAMTQKSMNTLNDCILSLIFNQY